MKEVALPPTPTLTAHHHGTTDLLPSDVAEMELISNANRDMFSWLLFNSEHITAPGSNTSSVNGTLTLDDPFRMLAADDAALALGLQPPPSTSSSTGPLLSTDVSTLLATTSAVDSALKTTVTATATTANSSVTTSPTVTTTVTAGVDSTNRRAKKRPAVDSPLAGTAPSKLPATTNTKTITPTAAATPTPTGSVVATAKAITSTQGLLRHLESANNALTQKRQATVSGVISPKTEIINSGNNSGNNSNSGSDNSLSNLQRRQKLERNRESARECRRRKREHILGVEERCRQLERENMELRGQLKAGKEAMRQEEKEKNRVCEELEQMIQRGASEKELAEKIDNFKEQYSDYGHGRRSALSYHLHQIERLLLPTQVTKMCIWALRQDDSFWQDEEDETSLPVILAKELGLSEEQKKKIQQQRGSISIICENLKSALALLGELRTEVINKNSTLDMEMDKLQNILTPTQRAKFIVWVTNNQACMHLLNKLWRSVL